MGKEFQICKMTCSEDPFHNNANILNTTALSTLKWLLWKILCFVLFFTKNTEHKIVFKKITEHKIRHGVQHGA